MIERLDLMTPPQITPGLVQPLGNTPLCAHLPPVDRFYANLEEFKGHRSGTGQCFFDQFQFALIKP